MKGSLPSCLPSFLPPNKNFLNPHYLLYALDPVLDARDGASQVGPDAVPVITKLPIHLAGGTGWCF